MPCWLSGTLGQYYSQGTSSVGQQCLCLAAAQRAPCRPTSAAALSMWDGGTRRREEKGCKSMVPIGTVHPREQPWTADSSSVVPRATHGGCCSRAARAARGAHAGGGPGRGAKERCESYRWVQRLSLVPGGPRHPAVASGWPPVRAANQMAPISQFPLLIGPGPS